MTFSCIANELPFPHRARKTASPLARDLSFRRLGALTGDTVMFPPRSEERLGKTRLAASHRSSRNAQERTVLG
jgi:hypothetical protein